MKMWSGRFSGGLDKHFEDWQRSFPFDRRLLPQEIAASSVYAEALNKAGVLNAKELNLVLEGLKSIADDVARDSSLLDDKEAEDIHHFVEKQLVKKIGDTGYKLHSGRSRNEQIATDLRLYVREKAGEVRELIAELCAQLVQRAQGAGQNAMPAYTHLQRAEPVLVAHWLLAYQQMFTRDSERIADCAKRANKCPLGSGAIAGSTLPLDRKFIARELGFDEPIANSMDATSDRDFAIEFVQALSVIGLHLSRWAEELIVFSTQEFAFIQLPETFSTGSSAMPQKKNPDALELIRAKSARVAANAIALQMNVKGLPLAYNKDLQDTQEPLFESVETSIAVLTIAAGFMRDVQFDFARMNSAAKGAFMNAFAAATYLVDRGVPFRLAHEIIGKAVRAALDKACALEDLSLDELKKLSDAFDNDFYKAITLENVLAIHDVDGGTAPKRVAQALENAKLQGSMKKEHADANA
jgi:argininosuccinate lyase